MTDLGPAAASLGSPIATGEPTGRDSLKDWTAVLQTCFIARHRVESVLEALNELHKKSPLDGQIIARLVLQSGAQNPTVIDPLIPSYILELLRGELLDTHHVLAALLACSQFKAKEAPADAAANESAPLSFAAQEGVLNLLGNIYAQQERPNSQMETLRCFRMLHSWLKACNAFESMVQMDAGGIQVHSAGLLSVYEALGTLAVCMLGSSQVKKHLIKPLSQAEKDIFATTLGQFATTLAQWSSTHVAPRLQALTRAPPFTKPNADGTIDFTSEEISNLVSNLPSSLSRAGLYIYLGAALCAGPLVDDTAVLTYLNARYASDVQHSITDLIVASFDVFANILHRREPAHHVLCVRSYIANKLPLLISSLSPSLYGPMTTETCIQMALTHTSVHLFPPLSADSGGINDTLRESRSEFLQACCLHQLMSEQVLAGQTSPSKPSKTNRYSRDTLISQCTANIHRVEELINEIDQMQGNAGAISVAVTETLQRFCSSKETMSLRTVCSAMSKRLPLMDIVLQHVQLSSILDPILTVLNEWTHDEDQSEFQPAYEDFAAILVLALALVHRYDLSVDDSSLLSGDKFSGRLLRQLSQSIPINDLSQEQQKNLGKWIKGLFATDDQGETSGISDEVMSKCSPQEFYLLVPTLFEHSVLACQVKTLTPNTLKGGLEFLLEPFLLPSLIGGISWLVKHSWEDHGDGNILLLMLDKLVRPTSISGDAKARHGVMLSMIAAPLMKSLRQLNGRLQNRKEISQLLETLRPHLDSQRSTKSSIVEIKEWTSTANGGVRRAVADLVRQLTTWSSQSELNPIPPDYTHRMFASAIQLLGAEDVLAVLVDEIRVQTSTGFGSAALEVGTALLCAPSSVREGRNLVNSLAPATNKRSPSPMTALKARLADHKSLLDGELAEVETLIRLGRLVDAQSATSQSSNLSISLTNIGTDELMQGMDMTSAEMAVNQEALDVSTSLAGTSAADFASGLDTSMDLGIASTEAGALGGSTAMDLGLSDDLFGTGHDMNFDLDQPAVQGQQQQGLDVSAQQTAGTIVQAPTDDDIFAGLDFGTGDDDFGF